MTKKFGQPTQSDITFWGIAALAAGGIAVLSSAVSSLLPPGLAGGLHTSIVHGGTLNQLQSQVARLQNQQLIIKRQANELRSQFRLAERSRADVNTRVGALETTIPQLFEAAPPSSEIDPLSITASIQAEKARTYDAEGGSVSIQQTPMFATDPASGTDSPPASIPAQPVPAPLEETPTDPKGNDIAGSHDPARNPPAKPNSQTAGRASSGMPAPVGEMEKTAPGSVSKLSQTQFGIAIGREISMEEADGLWTEISDKFGPLLIGLKPAISDPLHNSSFRIVLGPITNFSEAEMLCGRIARTGTECLPVQYADRDVTAL